MRGIYLDPQAPVINETYRNRFPENSVQVCSSEEEARQTADPANKRFAARVVGPSRSSEGLRIYYLSRWLDE
jgi:hypothetical protein